MLFTWILDNLENREEIMQKARDCGAVSSRLIDAREEMCRDFAFPVLAWQAKYEQIYLLGTSIARPLISKICLQVAREVGATAYAHGATGKGNDQCRFQLAAEALDPNVQMIAPWQSKFVMHSGRTELIAYCENKNIPVKASTAKPYSSDENVLHISYEAGQLEELDVNGVEMVDFGMGVARRSTECKASPSGSSPGSCFLRTRSPTGNGGATEPNRRPKWRWQDRYG